MKNFITLFCCGSLLSISCQKSKEAINPIPVPETFINTASASTWNYHQINITDNDTVSSDYSITSLGKDTTINSKVYNIYSYSFGGHQYLNLTINNYYQYDSVPGGLGQIFERLYLKSDAKLDDTWKQNLSLNIPGIFIPVPVTITNLVKEKGISRTLYGTNYSNVIHVFTSISSSFIPSSSLTSAIDSYYAQNYGLIENTSIVHLDYQGYKDDLNLETKLVSAVLK